MKEELITFETAKWAEDKGYPFTYIYDEDFYRVPTTAPTGVPTGVPTQSLLQKWLREKHNIILWVEFGYTKEWFSYYLNKYDDKIQLSTTLREATYEEALEKGLQEALKLIK